MQMWLFEETEDGDLICVERFEKRSGGKNQ